MTLSITREPSRVPRTISQGDYHLGPPLRQLVVHRTCRASSCAKRGVPYVQTPWPCGRADSNTRPAKEGVSFSRILRPQDLRMCNGYTAVSESLRMAPALP